MVVLQVVTLVCLRSMVGLELNPVAPLPILPIRVSLLVATPPWPVGALSNRMHRSLVP